VRTFIAMMRDLMIMFTSAFILILIISMAIGDPILGPTEVGENQWQFRMEGVIEDIAFEETRAETIYTIKGEEVSRDEVILYIANRWAQSLKE